jgi:hypothetical protein
MAHRTRGHISHTYDIKKVHSVDPERLTITYTDAAHAERQTVRLQITPVTPAAQQILDGMAASLRVYGDGDWESARALRNGASACTRMLTDLQAQGIRDFASENVTLQAIRDALAAYHDTTKRTLNKLLGRVLRKHHPQGSALAQALSNTAYMVRESRTEPYDDDIAAAIEAAARGVFTDAYLAHREALEALGIDTRGRAWLTLPAGDLVDCARETYAGPLGGPPPPSTAPRAELVAWAILHPEVFGRRTTRAKLGMPSSALTAVGHGLYPAHEVLTAALILQCLADDVGLNLSTMLRTDPTDLVYIGLQHGILTVAKARNHSEDELSVRTSSMFSLGGLVETLTALTRLPRHHRATHLATGEDVPEVVNKIYVEHLANPRQAEILTDRRIHNAWRSTAFDRHWELPDVDRGEHGLRFRALRNKSLERAIKKDPDADVHGHSQRTRLHYLAHVLPEHTLVRHAAAAQDDMLETALSRFVPVTQQEDGAAGELAAVDQADLLDVVVGVCSSAGNDPDDVSTPCSLGLAACFTCPNGFRTADHVPGLLATVAFTEIIRDNDPDEWEHGDAGLLHHYATKCLDEFPESLVDTARASVDLTPHIININGLYTELRR